MATPISTILFTTDLSKNSYYAFGQVVSLAKATGAAIRMLHVCEPLSEDARVTMMMFMQDKKARNDALEQRVQERRDRLDQRQDDFWSRQPEEDLAVRQQIVATQVLEGPAAEVILREAKKHKCDLIILGAHKHAFSHTYLGTVAKRVISRADMLTMIVPYKSKG